MSKLYFKIKSKKPKLKINGEKVDDYIFKCININDYIISLSIKNNKNKFNNLMIHKMNAKDFLKLL